MNGHDLHASRDMHVKIRDDNGAFIGFAGLQTKNLGLSAKIVDATHLQSSGQWRELLPGAGIKSATIKGEGIFTDTASSQLARSVFFTQAIKDYQFTLPDFGTIEGPFLMSELTYHGHFEGVAQYDITLLSAGEPLFTPAS